MSRAHTGLALGLGTLFIGGGLAKLRGTGPGPDLGDRLDLSVATLRLTGCFEIAGGLGLLAGVAGQRQVGAAAGAGLTLLATAGAAAHVRAREPLTSLAPACVLGSAAAALARSFTDAR